jgi:putative copper export protein
MLNDHLNFFVWMCRALHIFSAVGWIGGIGFLNGVASPIFTYIGDGSKDTRLRLQQRFIGYVWTCVWGLLVSGVILMLMSGKFLWFDFSDMWRVLLLGKQILFLVMVGISLIISRSLKDIVSAKTALNADQDISDYDVIEWRISSLNKLNMLCGIVAILLAAAM